MIRKSSSLGAHDWPKIIRLQRGSIQQVRSSCTEEPLRESSDEDPDRPTRPGRPATAYTSSLSTLFLARCCSHCTAEFLLGVAGVAGTFAQVSSVASLNLSQYCLADGPCLRWICRISLRRSQEGQVVDKPFYASLLPRAINGCCSWSFP